MEHALDMELVPIKFSSLCSISSPHPRFPAWSDVPVVSIAGVEFVECKVGCKKLTQWLSGSRAYNTKVTALIKVLEDMQVRASQEYLGHHLPAQLSPYREKIMLKALKLLEERSPEAVVDITFEEIEFGGVRAPACAAKMPVRVAPTKAVVERRQDVLLWLFLKYHSMPSPTKRKANLQLEDEGAEGEAGAVDTAKGSQDTKGADEEKE